MKKLMMAVVCAVATIVMTGCGGSPKSVAEDFANAIIQKDSAEAAELYNTMGMSEKAIKNLKEGFDAAGKAIDDNKLTAVALHEKIEIPSEIAGYTIIDGKKISGKEASVLVQFTKGKDKKDKGMNVELVEIDGSWKVKDMRLRDID